MYIHYNYIIEDVDKQSNNLHFIHLPFMVTDTFDEKHILETVSI